MGIREYLGWGASAPPALRNQADGYTDRVVQLIQDAVSGEIDPGLPAGLLAIRAAAGVWGRALAALEATGPGAAAVTPEVSHTIGVDIVLFGQSRWLASRNRAGVVELRRASGAERTQSGWRLDFAMPNGIEQVVALESEVLNFHWRSDPSRPWVGIPPWAGIGADMAAALERALRDELAGPQGTILSSATDPVMGGWGADRRREYGQAISGRTGAEGPQDGTIDASAVKQGLTGARRGGMVHITLPPGFSLKPTTRIGAEPAEAVARLRENIPHEIAAACGVPPAMLAPGGGAGGQREAFRQFLHVGVHPMAKRLAAALSGVLGQPVTFDARPLNASDIASKARAYGVLVSNGMSEDEAAAVVGLD